MTYHEAKEEIARLGAQESADLARLLEEARGPDGEIPRRDDLPLREQIRLSEKEASKSPILFHRLRKRSRGATTLGGGHPDGRLRWTGATLMEGGPEHPRWQARLAASDPLTEAEIAEDDWWVESYDPLDF